MDGFLKTLPLKNFLFMCRCNRGTGKLITEIKHFIYISLLMQNVHKLSIEFNNDRERLPKRLALHAETVKTWTFIVDEAMFQYIPFLQFNCSGLLLTDNHINVFEFKWIVSCI